jgi:hypothetical protein
MHNGSFEQAVWGPHKPSIKKVPLRVAKESAIKTPKHETKGWEIEDWRKNSGGTLLV